MISSFCGNSKCVDVEQLADGRVLVRHSADPGTVLTFDAHEWRAFLAGVKAGEFNLPD